MSQLVSAWPLIIMPQEDITLHYKRQTFPGHSKAIRWLGSRVIFQLVLKTMHHICELGTRGETHIQTLQTVPAEGVFAALTQHLCTALVPLDVDSTHRALLDDVRDAVGANPVDAEKRCRRERRRGVLKYGGHEA